MKRIVIFSLLFLPAIFGFSQPDAGSGETGFINRYADFDFKGAFAALAESDEVSNYYLLDFSKLPARFERIYFMNLAFAKDHIVNIEFDAERSIACFKANSGYPDPEVMAIFDDLLAETGKVAESWLPAQQTAWLVENDKYK